MTSACENLGVTTGGRGEYAKVHQAQGSLVKTDGMPDPDMIPSLLALTDVMATGWHAAVAARVEPGCIAVVVGDGAVGLLEMTKGVGADAVLECVGTDAAMRTAFRIARPGSTVGFVGAPHGVRLPVRRMFAHNVGLAGGMAPVRAYLPDLLRRTLSGAIDPGKVFDLTLPLGEVAEGYRAMDERRAIKVLLEP